MERNLALELVRVTEAAALASARWMGKGDGEAADRAAREAVGLVMKSVKIVGRVVVRPNELQVGVVVALVGAPFFVFLVRRRRLEAL